jgi:hypothetical protein
LRGALRFLLARQNGLHYVAGLGDVGEVNLGAIFLLGSRRSRGLHSALQKSTDLVSLTCFDGARMGLAFGQTQASQSIENLFTFDFQLTRQIVNSNLTHPPLFVVLPYAGYLVIATSRQIDCCLLLLSSESMFMGQRILLAALVFA